MLIFFLQLYPIPRDESAWNPIPHDQSTRQSDEHVWRNREHIQDEDEPDEAPQRRRPSRFNFNCFRSSAERN